MDNPQSYTASSVALCSANIKEIYPDIFYTNSYGLCDAQTIRVANIKLVIVIDQILLKEIEYSKGFLQWTNLYHKRIPGVNDCTHPYRYGSDVEIIDRSFGGNNEPLYQIILSCHKIARRLTQAKKSGERSLIIDYNNDQQKGIVIVTAYLIFNKTHNYYLAYVELMKSKTINAYLDNFHSYILFEFETLINIPKYKKIYLNKDDPAFNDTWKKTKIGSKKYMYLPCTENDNKEKLNMLPQLNVEKLMEDFVLLDDEMDLDILLTEDKYLSSGAGNWNDPRSNSHNDIFYQGEHNS